MFSCDFVDLLHLVSCFPTRFLFDESCADYKYYAFRLSEEEKSISQAKESGGLHSGNYYTPVFIYATVFFMLFNCFRICLAKLVHGKHASSLVFFFRQHIEL